MTERNEITPLQRLGRIPSALAAAQGRKAWLYACLFGMVLTLAFAPFNLLPCAVIAFSGLLFLLEGREKPRNAFAIGWWFGLGHHVTGLYWICIAMGVDGGAFLWMIPFTLLLLPAYCALFSGLTCWLLRRLQQVGAGSERLVNVLLFAGLWVLAEIAREKFLYGFPWNNLGYITSTWLPLMQGAAITGVYGMSFWMALAAGAFTLLWPPQHHRAFLLLSGLSVALAGWGIWHMHPSSAMSVKAEARPLVRIVQANVPQSLKWDPKAQMQALQNHADLTLKPGTPDYIVWPETAMPYPFESGSHWAKALGALLPERAVLLTGVLRASGDRDHWQVWNALQAVNRQGEVVAHYDKNVLVPFGEFVPLRTLLAPFGLNKITPGATDFSRGEGARLLDAGGAAPLVQPLICYETIFPAYRTPGEGVQPDWLLNLTNDAWFGNSSGPYQHLEMARMRAVERGAPMVRAANTGISAVFDPYGRELGRIPLNASGILDTRLPQRLIGSTWYNRFGELTILITILTLFTALFVATRKKT